MHTRARAILAVTVALAVTALMGLAVMTEQPVYAKGVVKSSGGGGSNSDSSSGSSSKSSSSSDRDDSGSSSRSSTSSGSSHSSSSSSRSSIDSRSETRRYEAPSSSSTNRLDQDFYLRSPGSRLDTRKPTPTYRKDYAEIGDIWKGRQEKREDSFSRDSSSRSRYDSSRRDGWYYDRDDDWRWNTHGHSSSLRYRHYCYDYRPTYCYPSVYCYYYDYYPPYIGYDRVIVITRLPNTRFYAEIPVFIYKRSSDYYLSNSVEKSLWSTLRDVQQAWERSDPELLMDHVERRSVVDVYLSGEYSYSVEEMDYYDMTRDAMSVIKTRSFDFDKVSRLDGNRYVAHGTHMYSDRNGLQKTVFVTYTFQRYRDEWYITSVGSSPHPI